MAKLHAPLPETIWTVFFQHCLLFLHYKVCVGLCLPISQHLLRAYSTPSIKVQIRNFLIKCRSPQLDSRRHEKSHCFFLLTTALFNLAECLAHGRDLTNMNWVNEWVRETEGERRGHSEKEAGLFTPQNTPHDPAAMWWIRKGATCKAQL